MPAHIKLLSLSDIGCTQEIPETSKTIEGNAVLKSTYIKNKYNLDCFADDTGLEVTTLNNEPGIFSARYAGPDNNALANMNKLLGELAQESNRKANFKTAVSLMIQNSEHLFLGICKGNITHSLRGKLGFGYDPIFQPEGYQKTFAEMSLEEKSKIGHRGKAIRLLIEFLTDFN